MCSTRLNLYYKHMAYFITSNNANPHPPPENRTKE